jgi:thiamine biosynthesis protein ThiI
LTLQAQRTIIGAISEPELVGKAVFLVSGGLDSPVAALLLIRKGIKPIFAYFDNYPLCDQAAEGIAVEAIRQVCSQTKTEKSRLFIISHSPDLQEIMSKCPPKFACILSRRIMFRIAQELAIKEGCGAIVTGDAIGQKASQTLQNIVAADSILKHVQVLRPLVGMNKLQIERYAKSIGTYEISIRPGVASCGVPTNNPSTAAKRDLLDEIEGYLDTQAMVTRAVENARLVIL